MPHTTIDSPIGPIVIRANDRGITSISFSDALASDSEHSAIVDLAARQLAEYFEGTRTVFQLPLDAGGTPFQRRVWNALLDVPFGKTASYLQIARLLGDEQAIRAVGLANGKNPIAIVVPCHRIIGSDGSLTGYAGGLWRKEWLLRHEGVLNQTTLF
ncbi:MAG: methylated-DNA--[protein]-cysteine S-methyltransferase [Bacteroidetes bacterium]|nr:methylated-DNA--[protein]-cysteine S-methyltransferase [Bacteroidota bacterium]